MQLQAAESSSESRGCLGRLHSEACPARTVCVFARGLRDPSGRPLPGQGLCSTPSLTLSPTAKEWASEKSPWMQGTEADSSELKTEVTGWEVTPSPRTQRASGRAASRAGPDALVRDLSLSISEGGSPPDRQDVC